MGAVYLDDIMTYLYESDVCMESYKELDDYVVLFEADDPKVKAQMEENDKATNGALDNIKKAADAIIVFIKKCMQSISEFFKRLKMTDAEKEAFNHFREVCKADPELKNKKITVNDWTKVKGEYDELLKEAAKAEKELYEGKVNDCQKLIARMENFIKGAAGGVATAVSAEVAVRIAGTSQGIAKLIYDKLDKEGMVMEKLSASLGKHQANKFKRQIGSLRHVLSLQRAKMKMMNTYHKSVENAVFSIYDDVRGLGSVPTSVATDEKGKIAKIKQGAKGLYSNRNSLYTTSSLASRLNGNKEIHDVTGNTTSALMRVSRSAKKENKYANKADKEREKLKQRNEKRKEKGDVSYQSPYESLLGLNDEDSRIKNAIDNHQAKKELKRALKDQERTQKKSLKKRLK